MVVQVPATPRPMQTRVVVQVCRQTPSGRWDDQVGELVTLFGVPSKREQGQCRGPGCKREQGQCRGPGCNRVFNKRGFGKWAWMGPVRACGPTDILCGVECGTKVGNF